jgi:hypothetical protein
MKPYLNLEGTKIAEPLADSEGYECARLGLDGKDELIKSYLTQVAAECENQQL